MVAEKSEMEKVILDLKQERETYLEDHKKIISLKSKLEKDLFV
jgi:hypothetical protein